MNEQERLWKNVRGYFEAMITGQWVGVNKNIDKIASNAVQHIISGLTEPTQETSDKIIDWFKRFLPISPELESHLEEIKKLPAVANMILLYGVGLFIITGWLKTHLSSYMEKASWKPNQEVRPSLPDPGALIAALWKEPERWDKIKQYLDYAGFEDEAQRILIAAGRQFEGASDILSLVNRGEMAEEEGIARLGRGGFGETEAKNILKLRHMIPPVVDIIRFAVREAFYEDYAEEYGLDEEYPEQLTKYAQMQGLAPEFSKYYWRSHWELPSLLQGFEMLHRREILPEDLDKLFMATDIMPWWREKLKAISFVPFTRVDVRRMHKVGVLNPEQVKEAYMDVGYDEDKAQLMTDFTLKHNAEEEKELTKGQVINAMDWDIIDPLEATALLVAMGYSEHAAESIIAMHQYNEAEKANKALIKVVEHRYKTGEIDSTGVYARFGELGISGTRTADILIQWDNEKILDRPQPSKADLVRWFKKGILTELPFKEEMRKLGFSPVDIYRYIRDAKE